MFKKKAIHSIQLLESKDGETGREMEWIKIIMVGKLKSEKGEKFYCKNATIVDLKCIFFKGDV